MKNKNLKRMLSIAFLSFFITGICVDSLNSRGRHRHGGWRHRGHIRRGHSWVFPTVATFATIHALKSASSNRDVVERVNKVNSNVQNLNERLDNIEQRVFVIETKVRLKHPELGL